MDLLTIAAIVIAIAIVSALLGLEGLLAHHLIEKHGKRYGTAFYILIIWALSIVLSIGTGTLLAITA